MSFYPLKADGELQVCQLSDFHRHNRGSLVNKRYTIPYCSEGQREEELTKPDNLEALIQRNTKQRVTDAVF